MDAWHKVAADAVIAELSGRKGFDSWWGPIDEDITDEIMDAIAAAILQAHQETHPTDHTHQCVRCAHEYTPVGDNEDCPKCGSNGVL